MKTYILNLEPHDNLISILDRMSWAQTGRILLVWTDHGSNLTRRLDLVMLKRRSHSMGIQLALVTKDPEVRYHARKLGIPLFPNAHKALKSRWRTIDREKKIWQHRMHPTESRNHDKEGIPVSPHALPMRPVPPTAKLPRTARTFFAILGVAGFLSVASIFIPRAEITLSPARGLQDFTFTVQAAHEDEKGAHSGSLPIRRVVVAVEGSDSIEPGGSTTVPDSPASGVALFTNPTNQRIRIPAGTIVRDPESGVRFQTTLPAEMPPVPGSTLEIPMTAISLGSPANLPAGALRVVEGPLGINLLVTNPEPTSGGSDRTVPQITSFDRLRLKNRLTQSLQTMAFAEIKSMLSPGDAILSSSPRLVRILEETWEPQGLEPAFLLSLDLRLEFEAFYVPGDEIERLAGAVLDATLPAGFYPIQGTLQIQHLNLPAQEGVEPIHWRLRATRSIKTIIDPQVAVNHSIRQPVGRVVQALEERLPLESPPLVTLKPDWWPYLPMVPFRIEVTIQD